MISLLVATTIILFAQLFMGVLLAVYFRMAYEDEEAFKRLPNRYKAALVSSIALMATSVLCWVIAGLFLTSGNAYVWVADVIEGFIGTSEMFSVLALVWIARWKRG